MDPKKVVVFVLLLVMLIFVGRWGYKKYQTINTPAPAAAGGAGYGYNNPAPANSPAPAAATPGQ